MNTKINLGLIFLFWSSKAHFHKAVSSERAHDNMQETGAFSRNRHGFLQWVAGSGSQRERQPEMTQHKV